VKAPVKKNVAGTPALRRVDKIAGTPLPLAPASKVSATTRDAVGICCHTLPKSGFRLSGVDVVGLVEVVAGSEFSVLEGCVVGATVVVVGATAVVVVGAVVAVVVLREGLER